MTSPTPGSVESLVERLLDNARFLPPVDACLVLEAVQALRELDHQCEKSMETIAYERARAEAAEAKLERAVGVLEPFASVAEYSKVIDAIR